MIITYSLMPLINTNADESSMARSFIIDLSLQLHPYFFCLRAVKALASLHICAGLPEPLLLADAINAKISCVAPYVYFRLPM